MTRLSLLLVLCLLLSGRSAPAGEAPELTVEEAREVLAQALLERDSSYRSYDPETGFEADGLHFLWSDRFWEEEVPTATAGDTEIYCFDLVFGPDADGGRNQEDGNPLAGRLCASYGVGKDGTSLWHYRQDLGEWEPLISYQPGKDGTL